MRSRNPGARCRNDQHSLSRLGELPACMRFQGAPVREFSELSFSLSPAMVLAEPISLGNCRCDFMEKQFNLANVDKTGKSTILATRDHFRFRELGMI
jgi:hypothetical protein